MELIDDRVIQMTAGMGGQLVVPTCRRLACCPASEAEASGEGTEVLISRA